MTIFNKLTVTSIFILCLLVASLFTFFITGGIFGNCSENKLLKALSPTGEYEATVLQRDCGATTSTAFHVQLSRLDTQQTESVFIVESSFHPSILWDDANNLKITFLAKNGESFYKKLVEWNKIKIAYKTE